MKNEEIERYEQNPEGNTSMVSRDVGVKIKLAPVRESTLWVGNALFRYKGLFLFLL